jgi:2-C-methyl-D-erythritol 4-phosphate cytidylyltransferase
MFMQGDSARRRERWRAASARPSYSPFLLFNGLEDAQSNIARTRLELGRLDPYRLTGNDGTGLRQEHSTMESAAAFSVVVLTAAPAGQAAEAAGAYVKIDGREALLRSIELFLNRADIKQIQLVVLPEELEEAKRKYGAHLGFSGVKLLAGGPKWMDQLVAASKMLAAEATHVLVHDAARPAVAYSDIDAIMAAAQKHDCVVLTSPVRSTLVEVDEGGNALAYHLPATFLHLMTPHALSKAKFLEMTSSGREIHPSQTHLLKGSPLNIRIGGPGDATLAKAMLNMLPKPKVKPPSSPFEEAQW